MRSYAAVLGGPGDKLNVESLDLVDIPSHCLLIRTRASGVCGTDLHVQHGTMESKFGFPVVLGHEAAGIVHAVGAAVRDFSEHDRVVISAITPCLSCDACNGGRPYLCNRSWEVMVPHPFRRDSGEPVHAFFGIGSLSEYVVVPASSAVKLPEGIPWPVGALVACAGQTGLGTVFNIADVRPGSTVAVFGCGPVGLCVIMASKMRKAALIVGVDPSRARLNLALELGADAVVNPTMTNPEAEIRKHADGGIDIVFECVGKVEVMEQAFRFVKAGGMLVVVGAPPLSSHFSIDARELLVDRKVVGSFGGSVNPRRDYPLWFELYSEGVLAFDGLVAGYRLENVNDAFADMTTGTAAKPVILFP